MSVEQARMDQLLREVYGRTPGPPRKKRPSEYPWRLCTRCGIQTRCPDLCRDCTEVLQVVLPT